jgi:hypothetical protein
MLTAGIARDRVPLTAASATDVGVSYGLVAVLGLLSARPGWRRRRTYSAILGTGLLAMLLVSRSFTDLGHLVAWLVGLTVALVVRKALAGVALLPRV